jgi:hypothetical protein
MVVFVDGGIDRGQVFISQVYVSKERNLRFKDLTPRCYLLAAAGASAL